METPAHHPFLSAHARQAYLARCDQRSGAWPVESETRVVETFHGRTFVRVSGPAGAPPLVLLPGSVLHSLMWLPNIEALSRHFRTYAVDNIYDSGLSVYTRALTRPEDFVRWMDELFTALAPDAPVWLMGLSYGSWLTTLYALRFPQRLSHIVLLAHPALVSVRAEFILRFLLCFVSPPRLADFVHWLFQDTARKDPAGRKAVEDLAEDMLLAARCFKPKAVVTPTRLRDRELRALRTPALFLFGEHERTFSSKKAIRRIQKVAPHLQTELVRGAGHDLNYAQAEWVNARVIGFLQPDPE